MRKINMVYLIAVLAICALPMFSFGEMVEENDLYRLSAKGVPWWMQFPKSDYKLKSKRRNPDGKSDYYMFSSESTGLSVSFYIGPAENCTSSAECRDMYWQNPGPHVVDPQRVRQYDMNGFSIVEFYVPTLRQMNASGHLVRGSY